MFNVTSKNRGAAKRLLTVAGLPAASVRMYTLAELAAALRRLVDDGLMTDAGVRRALQTTDRQRGSATSGERHQSDTSDTDGDDGAIPDGDGDDGDATGDDASPSNSDDGETDGDADGDADGDGETETDGDGETDGESEADDGDDDADDDDGETAADDDADDEEPAQDFYAYWSNRDCPIRHEKFEKVLKFIGAGENVALIGPAGTGKSTLVAQVADELGLGFTGTGAVYSKYDLIGFVDAGGTFHESPLYDAFVNGKLFCFDELDASDPGAVCAFNGVTDRQKHYAFPNGMQTKHDAFVSVCCMNTFGDGPTADYVGRYKQDKAAMTRFVKVYIDYDRRIECRIGSRAACETVWAVRDACTALALHHVCSTRMIEQYTSSEAAGVDLDDILDCVVYAGLTDDQRAMVEAQIEKGAK